MPCPVTSPLRPWQRRFLALTLTASPGRNFLFFAVIISLCLYVPLRPAEHGEFYQTNLLDGDESVSQPSIVVVREILNPPRRALVAHAGCQSLHLLRIHRVYL